MKRCQNKQAPVLPQNKNIQSRLVESEDSPSLIEFDDSNRQKVKKGEQEKEEEEEEVGDLSILCEVGK